MIEWELSKFLIFSKTRFFGKNQALPKFSKLNFAFLNWHYHDIKKSALKSQFYINHVSHLVSNSYELFFIFSAALTIYAIGGTKNKHMFKVFPRVTVLKHSKSFQEKSQNCQLFRDQFKEVIYERNVRRELLGCFFTCKLKWLHPYMFLLQDLS